MKKKSVVFVRTDAREYTKNVTLEVLRCCFPLHRIQIARKPLKDNTQTQTQLFGDKSKKPGETNIILTRD